MNIISQSTKKNSSPVVVRLLLLSESLKRIFWNKKLPRKQESM